MSNVLDGMVLDMIYKVEAQRLRLGMSREALSTEAGYGRSYWSDTMNGRSKCRCVDAFQRCAEAVGFVLCVNGRAASVNQILLAIDDERERLDWKRYEVARIAGIRPCTYSSYMSGAFRPSLLGLVRLAAAVGLRITCEPNIKITDRIYDTEQSGAWAASFRPIEPCR
jgi:transcriptional regulator with XRE-family HTH domain